MAVLDEARHWLAAVETYLSAKQAEVRRKRTARLLEARIGELLPREQESETTCQSRMTGYTETTVMSSGSWPSIGTYGRTSFHCRDAGSCALSVTTRPTCALSRRSRLDLRCDLRCGDFRDVLANIPDGSIDLILTDPPYPAEFLPLWTALAQFAVAKLAPQGVLAAMSGQTHLPEVIARLGEHLTYRWMIAYRMSGQPTSSTLGESRRCGSRCSCTGPQDRRLYDVATSKAPDKDFHGWGQSESGMYDPTRPARAARRGCLRSVHGRGTTAIVARAHGCHFVGAEVDEATYERAARRIAP